MDSPDQRGNERSVSGRKLVTVALVVIVLVTAASAVFGPALRDRVRDEQRPRTLREPIATGEHQGQVWEAVGRFDGEANCVELRYAGEVLDRACDAGAPRMRATKLADGGPTVAYGVAPDGAEDYDVPLAGGDTVNVPVAAGDLGFPVGFWATLLPEGTSLATDAG